MAYEELVEVAIKAPGRCARHRSLEVLRSLAIVDGDFEAVVALCRVLAFELGHDPNAPGLCKVASLDELTRSADIPALLRLYALGFVPRTLLADLAGWQQSAADTFDPEGLVPLQMLVRRRSPAAKEVLLGYVLAGFVISFGNPLIPQGAMSGGLKLWTVDKICSGVRIVAGDQVDTTFAFGREKLLRLESMASEAPHGIAPKLGVDGCRKSLLFIIGHELGHYQQLATDYPGADLSVAGPSHQSLSEFAKALPGLLAVASERTGQQLTADDPRRWRSSELTVICTWEESPAGSYTHLSFSSAGGPVGGPIGDPGGPVLMLHGLRLIGVDPTEAVAVQTARGLLHVGVAGAPPLAEEVGARAGNQPPGPEEAAAWFAGLQASGRVGRNENTIRYMLGVEPWPTSVYASKDDTTLNAIVHDLEVCQQIEQGADLTGVPPAGLAKLVCLAVRCGHPVVLQRALAAGATVEPADVTGAGVAQLGRSRYAVRNGAAGVRVAGASTLALFATLGVLHQAGVDLDGPISEDGDTLLSDAAARSGELVSALLAVGVSPDVASARGETPLAVAADFPKTGAAQPLLEAGASVEARDADGLTPLHRAARAGAADLCTTLIARGADADAPTGAGETPLTCGARAGAADVVHVLLEAGVDPGWPNDLGDTAMHLAMLSPEGTDVAGIVAALAGAGASGDDENNDGITPLILASRNARPDLVKLLLAHGAEPNIRGAAGNTALIFASEGRHESGNDPTDTSRMEECIRLLVGAGADINAANDRGETSLHWAANLLNERVAEALLELGADPNVTSTSGVTPVANAHTKGHTKLEAELAAAGAHSGEGDGV